MSEGKGTRPKVLLVDDDPVTLNLLELHLKALGYEPVKALTGEEALERAAQEQPAAVLLDIQLPGIDGLETCRRLRARPETSGTPILMLTALTDLETRIEGFEAGADDYISKPFELRELGARLRAHISLAEQRRRLATLEGVLGTVRMLSHNFNNPLQAVLGGLQFVTGEAAGSEVSQDEGLQMVREGVDELVDLAQRLNNVCEPVFTSTPIGKMLDVQASTQPG